MRMYAVYTCKDLKWSWNMLGFDLPDCVLRKESLLKQNKYDRVSICTVNKCGEEYNLKNEVN